MAPDLDNRAVTAVQELERDAERALQLLLGLQVVALVLSDAVGRAQAAFSSGSSGSTGSATATGRSPSASIGFASLSRPSVS